MGRMWFRMVIVGHAASPISRQTSCSILVMTPLQRTSPSRCLLTSSLTYKVPTIAEIFAASYPATATASATTATLANILVITPTSYGSCTPQTHPSKEFSPPLLPPSSPRIPTPPLTWNPSPPCSGSGPRTPQPIFEEGIPISH